MASLAQMERELIAERTQAGLAAARQRGRPAGRKRRMTPGKVQSARQLLLNGVPPPEKSLRIWGCRFPRCIAGYRLQVVDNMRTYDGSLDFSPTLNESPGELRNRGPTDRRHAHRTGLTVQAGLDQHTYPTGIKIGDDQMAQIQLQKDRFHGEWNYTISPATSGKT